jgi:hypothetical protein
VAIPLVVLGAVLAIGGLCALVFAIVTLYVVFTRGGKPTGKDLVLLGVGIASVVAGIVLLVVVAQFISKREQTPAVTTPSTESPKP